MKGTILRLFRIHASNAVFIDKYINSLDRYLCFFEGVIKIRNIIVKKVTSMKIKEKQST